MSPDAVIGLMHLCDRFGLMLRCLAGEPPPPPPALPGRRCRPLGDDNGVDKLARQWDELERRVGSGALGGGRRWLPR